LLLAMLAIEEVLSVGFVLTATRASAFLFSSRLRQRQSLLE